MSLSNRICSYFSYRNHEFFFAVTWKMEKDALNIFIFFSSSKSIFRLVRFHFLFFAASINSVFMFNAEKFSTMFYKCFLDSSLGKRETRWPMPISPPETGITTIFPMFQMLSITFSPFFFLNIAYFNIISFILMLEKFNLCSEFHSFLLRTG